MLAKINKVLTPARRKAVYGVVTAGVAALLVFQVITTDQLNSVVEGIVGIIAALTTLMAALNTSAGPNDSDGGEM